MLRRGQVTIFVIVGLLLLVAAGLLLLARDPPAQSPGAHDAAVRVSQLVQSCLASTGESVVREIGLQGGYLSIDRFRDVQDVRHSQVVTLAPQKVVLWNEVHPCSENPQGCYANNRPPLCEGDCPVAFSDQDERLPSIEEQLEEGIGQRARACVDFAALADLEIAEKGGLAVAATIREEDIHLSLNYPLSVRTPSGEEVLLEQFSATLDLNIARLYRLAAQVQREHRETGFLEEAFRHLLTLYSGVGSEIPPMREIELFGGQQFWMRTQVQERIEQDVLPFMDFMQLANTQVSFSPLLPPETMDPVYRPYAAGAYKYLLVKLDNATYPLASSFHYPGTPIYLDINGQELLRPQGLSGGGFLAELSGMAVQQYKFRYTVAFPLILSLSDPQAFGGKGYEFDVGLETNLYKNYPLNVSAQKVTLEAQSQRLDIADPAQLVDHRYEILVSDRRTGEPVEGIAITYACGARYQMGQTGSDGVWRGKLPYCFSGGAVLAEDHQYLADGRALENIEDDGLATRLSFELWPREGKLVRVLKRTPQDLLAGNASALAGDDSVFLQMQRHKEGPYEGESPLSGAVQFGTARQSRQALEQAQEQLSLLLENGEIAPEEHALAIESLREREGRDAVIEKEIDLVPGRYDLSGMLIHTVPIAIPEQRTSDYVLSGTNLSTWISGGAELTGDAAFTLTEEMVYSDAPLVIFVLEQPLPRTWEDIQNYRTVEEYQAGRMQLVQPSLSGS